MRLDLIDPKSIINIQYSLNLLKQSFSSGSNPLIWLLLIFCAYFVFRPGNSRKENGGFFYKDLIEIKYFRDQVNFLEWYRICYLLLQVVLFSCFSISLSPWSQVGHIIGIIAILTLIGYVLIKEKKNLFQRINQINIKAAHSKRAIVIAIFVFLSVLLASVSHSLFAIITRPFGGELSSGKSLLIDNSEYHKRRSKWLKNDDAPWKSNCKKSWQHKINRDYSNFLKECPNDPEAKIYQNNKSADQLAQSNPNTTIANIVVAVPISRENGEGVFQSVEILKGVAAAQDEINRSLNMKIGQHIGILRVHILDDGVYGIGEESQEAESAARYISSVASQKRILGIIGHSTSDATEAASKIYQRNGLVAISPSSTSPRIRGFRKLIDRFPLIPSDKKSSHLYLSSNIFRTAPNDERSSQKIQDYIWNYNRNQIRNRIKRVVVIYEKNNRYGELYKKQIVQALDQLDVEVLNNGQSDKDACKIDVGGNIDKCKELIRNKSVNAIILVPSSKSAKYLNPFVDLRKDNWNKNLHLLGSDSMYNEVWIRKPFAPYTKGMVVVAPYRITINGQAESWRTAMAYDATIALSKGIQLSSQSESCMDQQSDENRLDKCIRNNLANILSSKEFFAQGVNGNKVQFDALGDRVVREDQNNKRIDYSDKLHVAYCVRQTDGKTTFTELDGSEICP